MTVASDHTVRDGGARLDALAARIDPLDEAAADALALGIVDALLDGDEATLRALLPRLRERRAAAAADAAERARLESFAALAAWGAERLPAEAEPVGRGTQGWRFLAALAAEGTLGSTDLRARLDTDESQVSRTGRRLLDAGLVTRTKVDRRVRWDLTPRGRAAVESPAPPAARVDPDHFRDLMRTAWRAPEPAEGHIDEADPARGRILDATLELHNQQGILATTFAQIAERAGVPVEAVTERFPTPESLVPECGGLAFRRLRIPPAEEAASLFAGLEPGERIARLVEEIFAIYERDAPSLETIRRERGALPVLAAADNAVQEALDGLVAAALPEDRRDATTIAAVRSLTSIDVWRGLRGADRATEVVRPAVAALVA